MTKKAQKSQKLGDTFLRTSTASEILDIFREFENKYSEETFQTWTSSPLPDLLELVKRLLYVIKDIQEYHPIQVNPALKERPEFDPKTERAMVQLDQIPLTGTSFFLPKDFHWVLEGWIDMIFQLQSVLYEVGTQFSTMSSQQEKLLSKARSLTQDLKSMERQIQDRNQAINLLKFMTKNAHELNAQLLNKIKSLLHGLVRTWITDRQNEIARLDKKINYFIRKGGK